MSDERLKSASMIWMAVETQERGHGLVIGLSRSGISADALSRSAPQRNDGRKDDEALPESEGRFQGCEAIVAAMAGAASDTAIGWRRPSAMSCAMQS